MVISPYNHKHVSNLQRAVDQFTDQAVYLACALKASELDCALGDQQVWSMNFIHDRLEVGI